MYHPGLEVETGANGCQEWRQGVLASMGNPDQCSVEFYDPSGSPCRKRSDPGSNCMSCLQPDLAGPEAVSQACTASMTGHLTAHEAKIALQAMGYHKEQGQALDLERYRAMLDGTPSSGDPLAAHACRGISLKQLEEVDDVFCKSHWLQQCCDQANRANPDAKHVFECNMYALRDFLIKPVTTPSPEWRVPQNKKDAAKIPQAQHKCSFSELLNPCGVLVHYFASHWWGEEWSYTMKALQCWACAVCGHDQDPHNVVFWISLYALNQHEVAGDVFFCPQDGPFNAALAQGTCGAILVISDRVEPFKRLWCLFEVERLSQFGVPFKLVCDKGALVSLAGESETGVQRRETLEMVQRISDTLASISAFDATACRLEDQRAIRRQIVNSAFRQLPADTLEKIISEKGTRAFTEFDGRIRALLARPLLEISFASRSVTGIKTYLGLGAFFDSSDILQLERIGLNPTTFQVQMQRGCKKFDAHLLYCAARFGHSDALDGLLLRGADVDAVVPDLGRGAIHAAAGMGFAGIVEALLLNGADPELRVGTAGATALHWAADGGHMTAGMALLRHSANVMSRDGKGLQPIHRAATYGHTSFVEMLIKHGSAVCDCTPDGQVARDLAHAQCHSSTVEMLIEAEAAAASGRGLERSESVLEGVDPDRNVSSMQLALDELACLKVRWGPSDTWQNCFDVGSHDHQHSAIYFQKPMTGYFEVALDSEEAQRRKHQAADQHDLLVKVYTCDAAGHNCNEFGHYCLHDYIHAGCRNVAVQVQNAKPFFVGIVLLKDPNLGWLQKLSPDEQQKKLRRSTPGICIKRGEAGTQRVATEADYLLSRATAESKENNQRLALMGTTDVEGPHADKPRPITFCTHGSLGFGQHFVESDGDDQAMLHSGKHGLGEPLTAGAWLEQYKEVASKPSCGVRKGMLVVNLSEEYLNSPACRSDLACIPRDRCFVYVPSRHKIVPWPDLAMDKGLCLAALGNLAGDLQNPRKVTGDTATLATPKKQEARTTLPFFELDLALVEQEHGQNQIETAWALTNLGIVCGDLGDHRRKMELLERALIINEGEFGKDHMETARALRSLSNACGALGNHRLAKEP
eukprot:TRINITY_DN221_c0_g1_i1.p1 TRINITY_DN221_c0_g1~~TRINITY_DN221_c0_g1_i1.p1  ORF type:complete len:1091 (+),score=195.25 TRINITY_DN221_c0_g1_i1:141-3413(+)